MKMNAPPFGLKSSKRAGMARGDVVVTAFFITLLLLLLLTVVLNQRVKNRRILCELRQMRIARAMMYYEMVAGSFPGYRDIQTLDEQGNPRPASWVFFTLPFLKGTSTDELAELKVSLDYKDAKKKLKEDGLESATGPYAEIFNQFGPDAPRQRRGKTPSRYIPELVCPDNLRPSDDERTTCWMSYVVNTGMPDVQATDTMPADWSADGVFTDQFPGPGILAERLSFKLLQSRDGAGTTLMLSENVDSGLWTDVKESQVGFCWTPKSKFPGGPPRAEVLRINQEIGKGDGSIRFARPSSYHEGGVNVAFCDGRTQFLNADIDHLAYIRFMTSDSKNVRWPGTDKPISEQ